MKTLAKNKNIRKRGKKYYYKVMVTEKDGSRKQREFAGSESLKETEKMRIEAQAKYNKKQFIPSSNMPLFDLLDLWQKETSYNLRESTIINRQKRIRRLKKWFKNEKISKMSRFKIQKTFNELSETELKKSYISNLYGTLKLSFEYAINILEILEDNPCNRIVITGKKSKEERAYTRDEYIALKKHLFNKRNKTYYYFFVFGIKTGMRCGEMLALKWKDIDFENQIIKITKGSFFRKKEFVISEPKNKNSIRDIYVDDEVIEILHTLKNIQNENKSTYKQHYNDTNFIFQLPNGNNLGKGFISTFYRNIKEIVKINAPIHSMRHTHITWLIEDDANLKSIQYRVGHSDIKTTLNIYTHVTEKMKKDVVETTKKF